MSSSSYPLESPRRQPSPLQFYTASNQTPLLYDVPSSPTNPNSPPTSPRSRPHRAARHTSPSAGRKRSVTPAAVAQSDLEIFSDYCRSWYFKQDEEAGRLMTQTMATLPPSQRAPYSRIQASIRSAYHRSVNARRTAEFRAHLSTTQLGASLSPHARSHPRGSDAQKGTVSEAFRLVHNYLIPLSPFPSLLERYERFERFVRSWCTLGMPGPQPFFQALWAVMRLQVVPEDIGGAGRYRIQWEFDDAVLKEAAGKDFMLEAIDVLKGVLAFEEISTSRTSSAPSSEIIIHSRSQSSPFFSSDRKAHDSPKPKRARAPSDPFLDTPMSRSAGSSKPVSLLASENFETSEEPLTTPSTTRIESSSDDNEEEELRTWTTPDLTNPEFLNLVKVFPSHITRRTLPYFSTKNRNPPDLEAGLEGPVEVRCGTGTLRVSSMQRSDGWEGGWWTRFVLWLRRLFN
ncbi:hypothetical protein D9757_000728 [Collybiopsis confluens]|uniref:Uncharacterized protein n=1 Tax=Collybiopsis confluens TaxID=2823264 RepID=A0A8H5I1A5_9AGAR|nr:hypothetical protein D9757_000728 [Collybiopsis confluens]